MGDVQNEVFESEGVRANPIFLACVLTPIAASAALSPIAAGWANKVGLGLAVLGILLLVLFKQYASRLANEPAYEQPTWLDPTLVIGFVTGLALVGIHAYPWAKDIATRVCACL